jgi:hypothetical protein
LVPLPRRHILDLAHCSFLVAEPGQLQELSRQKLPVALIGREWLWLRLLGDIRCNASKQVLLLLADSGFGKSAIAVELFERQLELMRLQPVAFHICAYSHPNALRV